MTLYDGNKKVHHYFPKINHTMDPYEDFDDISDSIIIDDRHDFPYIGEFPPKDSYEEHRFY